MGNRNIRHLEPRLRELAQAFVKKANAALAPSIVRIVDTYRAPADQAAALASGASNASYGSSPHNCMCDGKPAARAFDFGVFGPDGAYIQRGEDPRYAVAGAIAKELGMDWGGDWTLQKDGFKPDWCHVQMRNWRTA